MSVGDKTHSISDSVSGSDMLSRAGSGLRSIMGNCSCCCDAMMLMGALFVGYVAARVAYRVWRRLRYMASRQNLSRYGEWAVVTGASDGIGKAMAIEIMRQGMNVVLVARNGEKLKAVEFEIANILKGNIRQMKSVVCDFSVASDAPYEELAKATDGLDVGIVVNNVGVSYPYAMYFDEMPHEAIDTMVMTNIRSTMRVTRHFYEKMRINKRGLIVCVGSGSSRFPTDPLYCGYAGSKGAIASFCESLQEEAADYNIAIQCHTPLLVTTKLSKCRTPSFTVCSQGYYAASAVDCMCHASTDHDNVTFAPTFVHAAMLYVSNLLPNPVWRWFRLGETKSLRKRALARLEEKKKAQ